MIRLSQSAGNWTRSSRLLLVALPLVGLALLLLSGYLAVRAWRPRIYHVRMLTDVLPTPALMARRIAANAGRHGLVVDLEKRSVTSLEALELVDSPNPIDVALVPGGAMEREYPNTRQITELALDPMHLLVRAELSEKGLPGLRGKRINLGPPRSVNDALARDLLRFAGLNHSPQGSRDSGDYIAESQTPQEMESLLARLHGLHSTDRERILAELPDAVFLLAPVPSPLAHDLVTTARFRLIPVAFADAYCLDRINATPLGDVTIDRSILAPYEIPAYTYGIDPAVPAVACRTIATRLILIGFAPTDAEAISRLLETIYDSQVAGVVDAKPLRSQIPLFPLHGGTIVYMRKNDPIFTPELIGNLGKITGGIGAFASGMVAFYGFLRLRQLRRFEAYYQDLRRLELVARGHEHDPDAPVDPRARRAYLEDRVLDLKSRALNDFAEGGLKGEGLMSGIVALVNDTRCSIDRIGRAEEAQPGDRP